MKLIMSIVNSDDSRALLDSLLKEGFRATFISTTGGFLRQGNATIFVGVEDEKVEEVLKIIRENCHTRKQFVNPLPALVEPSELFPPSHVEVEVGGATIFILDVERFERY